MIAALAAASVANAKVKLPSVMASNMVLQQQSDVNIWGKAAPGKTVTVTPSWSKTKATTRAAKDSTWQVSIATPKAGGPYTLTISDGEPLTLKNILIGEVWFCSGQSNMEMPMRGFDRQPLRDGSNSVIAHAKPSTPIRMFLADRNERGEWVRQWSRTPKDDMYGRWLTNTPEAVQGCSATAYYFAQNLQDILGVPVGIMVSTLGGSRIEPWISQEGLDQPMGEKNIERETPHIMYNAKINPLIRFGVRGFLWYQGESNVNQASAYGDLMKKLVADWRSKFAPIGQHEAATTGSKPFYFVEIAPFRYSNPDATASALLREQQQRAAKEIENAGMISLLDKGVVNFIHPVDKHTVGERLALMALGKTYGRKGFGWEQPMYKDMEVKDGKIYINVTGAVHGLCPMWTSLKGFEIAGKDRVFHPAFAEIEESTCRLAVSSKEVPEPVAVRYCFKNYAEATVFNIYGLPLAPFRTDNW